jgi:hypothetical protein
MQLEASFLLRVLRARRLATAIGRADAALKTAGDLFRAQTELLQELVQSAGESAEGQLIRAGDSHAYLRSRGLIAPEAAAPSPFESVTVSEAFRIGGVAQVGQMLDLVSALLDLLDARYGLYSPDVEYEDSSPEAEVGRPAAAEAGEDIRPQAPSEAMAGAAETDAAEATAAAHGTSSETLAAPGEGTLASSGSPHAEVGGTLEAGKRSATQARAGASAHDAGKPG